MPTQLDIECRGWTRREIMATLLAWAGVRLLPGCRSKGPYSRVFIAVAEDYQDDLVSLIMSGLKELAISPEAIRGKRILLKPNLVEPRSGLSHINTHPLVVRAAYDAFRRLGASHVIVAEGPGHCRDIHYVLEESGYADVLLKEKIPFVDINNDQGLEVENKGRMTRLETLTLPATLKHVDWIVSLPKVKTHHWTGVTLSMKNLFGLMPGIFYGWPKNVLHHIGIDKAIFDIAMTVRPQLAIVDGIIGMEGDGPIMGSAKKAGVIVMGGDVAAVDATCARIMGVDPFKIRHIKEAGDYLGSIHEKHILQVGEPISLVRNDFLLLEEIPAQRNIRLRS